MSGITPRSVCGVIIVSNDVERLAIFYRDLLGLPLKREEHGGLPPHYGVDIGTTHFGIHPPESFGLEKAGGGCSIVALQVDDLDAILQTLHGRGLSPIKPKHDEGFGPVAMIQDPDGNMIELVELRYEF